MESWKDTNPITFLTIIVALLVLVTAYQFYLISQIQDSSNSSVTVWEGSEWESSNDERWTLQLESNWEVASQMNEMKKQIDKLEKSLGSHTGDFGMPSHMNKHYTH